MESIKGLTNLVQVAVEFRKRARTFRTSVGVAIETRDGMVFGGFNIETYMHKGFHAEEVALIRGLARGYNGRDFKRLVVVFQDAGHSDVEIFPTCLSCLSYLNEFTHTNLEIVVADLEGNIHYQTTMGELFAGFTGKAAVYPSPKIRKVKPRLNSEEKTIVTVDGIDLDKQVEFSNIQKSDN